MRSALLSLVALVLLSTGLARAEGIRWATSFDAAMKEAKERGVLVLVVFNMSDPPEPANEEMIRIFTGSKAVHKACRKFVCIWANKDSHREIKQKVDGQMRSVCPHLGNAPCRVHKEMESVVVRRYGEVMISEAGDVKTPCQWLLDGDGKVYEIIASGDRSLGFDIVPEQDLVMRLAAAAKRYGPGLTSDEFHRLGAMVKEGDALKAAGNFAAAAAKYREVLEQTSKKVAAVTAAEAALAEIATFAEKSFEEADAQAKAGKYAEALALLDDVAAKFKGTSAEKRARARIVELKKNPEVARLMREAEALRASEKLLAAGRKAEEGKRWKKALDAYRGCAEKYPDTEAGKAAKARLDELMADPEIGAAIREAAAAKDCKGWLTLARNFINNNLPDRARVYLRKVLDKYPGTSYAKEAQALLDGLK